MRRVTAYCANLFDDLEVQCNVGRRAALDVNYSNHGAGGTGPLARSFHSQSIIAKPGDGRAHIDRRATVITFVETDRWITNSSGNVGVQLCLAVASSLRADGEHLRTGKPSITLEACTRAMLPCETAA